MLPSIYRPDHHPRPPTCHATKDDLQDSETE